MSNPQPPTGPVAGAALAAADSSQFTGAPTVGEARTQLGDAWHDYMYALSKKQPRQVNRIRAYASQMMGAVR